jgi:predicted NACHT family NTPase
VLIGEPGSGKTTTLQRLAYEFAVAALEDEAAPLPVLVPLGAYSGGGLVRHIAAYLGQNLRCGITYRTAWSCCWTA